MPDIENCCLVVVDVQGKLALSMHEKERLFKNIQILIKAAKILKIPILWCQQYPQGLGQTISEISELLPEEEPVNKVSFSCCGSEQFCRKLKQLSRRQILLCGIESHVCVYQTAVDLLNEGYEVDLISDAVSSRTEENKQIAAARMSSEGVKVSSVEMVLFELLRTSEHKLFKEIVKLVK